MPITIKAVTTRFIIGPLCNRQSASRLLVIMLSCLLVSGCSYFNKDKDAQLDKSAEELYADARTSIDKRNWETALEQLRTLEAQHPYGNYAIQARIDTIYIHYQTDQTGLAVAAADRFIKLHPTHESVDYVYYLKGLSGFEEDTSFFGRFLGRDDLSDRDISAMYNAFAAFEEVYTRFPDSRYAPDARNRAQRLRESMARNEVAVAQYYYSMDAHVAVVNRTRGVVENYASTNAVERALAMMMSSYWKMGLHDLSSDARKVLELNFPDSEYLKRDVARLDFYSRYTPRAKRLPGSGWVTAVKDRFTKTDSPATE